MPLQCAVNPAEHLGAGRTPAVLACRQVRLRHCGRARQRGLREADCFAISPDIRGAILPRYIAVDKGVVRCAGESSPHCSPAGHIQLAPRSYAAIHATSIRCPN